MATPQLHALDKGLDVLEALADGPCAIAELARTIGIPRSTLHRLITTLERRGFIARPDRGVAIHGPTLIRLAASVSAQRFLAEIARPVVRKLAHIAGGPAQLGVLDGDMVTYLVKEGSGSDALFTREGEQLEAYCSGLGKVLLAALPQRAREAYLAAGPFIPLTAQTMTDPEALAEEFALTARRDFGEDRGEVDINLNCLAVPIRSTAGEVMAALSLSARGEIARPDDRLAQLRVAAVEIVRRLNAANWEGSDWLPA